MYIIEKWSGVLFPAENSNHNFYFVVERGVYV